MKKVLIFLMLMSLSLCQGCAIGILAAGVGYAVGQGRRGTAAQMDAKSKYTGLYNDYKLGMENINLEREKAKLVPQPIMSFDEWIDAQPLTPEEAKIFKHNKAQTAKQITEQDKAKSGAQPTTTEVKTEPNTNFNK